MHRPLIINVSLLFALSSCFGLSAQKITLQPPEWHARNMDFSAFSPDYSYVMSGDFSRIILTDVRSGKIARSITPTEEASNISGTFTPDSKRLLIGQNDGSLLLWDIALQNVHWRQKIDAESITQLSFDPGGNYFLASTGKNFHVFTYPDIKLKFQGNLENNENLRSQVTFNKAGTKVIASNWWNDIKIWDVPSGKQLAQELPPKKFKIRAYDQAVNWYVAYPEGYSVDETLDKDWDDDQEHVKHVPVLYSLKDKKTAVPLDSLYAECEFYFSDDGRYLFAADNQTMSIDQYDLVAGKKVQRIKSAPDGTGSGYFSLRDVACSRDNHYLATLNYMKWLEIRELASGRLLHQIPLPYGDATNPKLRFSGDGKLLLYTNLEVISLYDVGSGSKIWSVSNESMKPSKMRWEKDGGALWTTHGFNPKSFRRWDLQKGKLSYVTTSQETINDLAISKDQTKILTAAGKSAELRRASDGVLLHTFTDDAPTLIQLFNVIFSPDGKQAALEYSYRPDDSNNFYPFTVLKIVDLESFNNIFTFSLDQENTVIQSGYSPDQKKLVSLYQNGTVVVLRAKDGALLHKLQAGKEGLEQPVFSPDSRYLAAASIDGHVYLWDIEKGKRLKRLDSFIWQLNFQHFSNDGRFLFWVDTFQHFNAWDVQKNKLAYTISEGEVYRVCYDDDPGYIYLSGSQGFQRRSMADGKLIRQYKKIPSAVEIEPLSGKAVDYNGALMRFYDLEKDMELYALLPVDSANYIFSLPSGEYAASKGAVQKTSFYLDNQRFDFEQFDLQTNRPDKVLEAMGCPDTALVSAYRNAYQKRLKKMGLRERNLTASAPALQLLAENLPVVTDSTQLTVTIRASDTLALLDRIFVFVNDVPVFGRQGISVRELRSHRIEKNIAVPLSFNPALGGKNKIQLSVMNANGVESVRQSCYVVRSKPAEKPFKYVIVLGTDTFARASGKTLDYAVKDARDVLQFFGQAEERFAGVKTWQLTGTDFTREKVMALRSTLLQTRTDDHVYIFVSSHGLLDARMDYYLATCDIAFDQPSEKGLPFDELENLLDGIPALNKLLLLDACHAGEIDQETIERIRSESTVKTPGIRFKSFDSTSVPQYVGLENSFELMKELFVDLRRSSGATVISSAGGAEYAIEGDAWQNSVFTYVLLSGLKDNKADLNKDGAVMVSELQRYLATEVPKLTDNQQKPTFRLENIANDWQIW